jgi:hypothetical protein
LVLWLNQVTQRFCGEPPQTPRVDSGCDYPAQAPIDDFVLLFLPPCGPHLTPLATGSLESGLLVSPLLGGPARHRHFAPSLHLHQRKSSCNLHLQYSANSPHHVVNHSSQPGATIHRSLDAPVLNLPLMSAFTTHTSNQFREKEKKRNERRTQPSDQKINKSQETIT